MKKFTIATLCSLTLLSPFVVAEPWVSTDNAWLRSDIETLANIGVIKSPINTWPVTWGPLLKDLKRVKLALVPKEYRQTYLRVLRTGKRETEKDNIKGKVRLSFNSEPRLFRFFGDKARDKRELSTSSSGMTRNLAWNFEVTIAPDSVDGDDKRFDGSYLAGVIGNWIVSVGQNERWWGPGWQHSIILSNNAKPIPSISIQRNYSTPFESEFLKWIGPWTANFFVGSLDDERTVDDAKLVGMSASIMPLDSIEIGFRRTAQWGGEGRPENFDSLVDLFIGLDNCDEGGLSCEGIRNEPGNQLAGIDISWRPNFIVPAKLYLQTVGEDEAGYFPSKKSYIYGVDLSPVLFDAPLNINLETINTRVDGDGNEPGEDFSGFNVLYEHGIYRNGYRYLGRSIGSTIDNDSTMHSLNLVYRDSAYGDFKFSLIKTELNKDSFDLPAPAGHSLVSEAVDFTEMYFNWRYTSEQLGEFSLSLSKGDKELQTNIGIIGENRYGLDWSYTF